MTEAGLNTVNLSELFVMSNPISQHTIDHAQKHLATNHSVLADNARFGNIRL